VRSANRSPASVYLSSVPQVQLRSAPSSQYVIRTQPNNMCVSTLECAAVALAIMENNLNIQEVCVRVSRGSDVCVCVCECLINVCVIYVCVCVSNMQCCALNAFIICSN